MDGLRIGATDVEAEVTELMVAEQTYNAAGAPLVVEPVDYAPSLAATTKGMLDLQLGGLEEGRAGVAARARIGGGGEPSGGDDDGDEITSDDSGDFEALTDGLDDATGYDLVRALVAFDKQQVRDIAALEAACARLEEAQGQLWRRAITAAQSRQRGGRQLRRRLYGSDAGTIAAPVPAGPGLDLPLLAREEVIDEDLDEFEDVSLDTSRSCRYGDPARSYVAAHPYAYAEPDAAGADFTPVFSEGFLFRAVTPEGAWVFYNDSAKYVMHVKYRLGSTSTVAAGPKARLTRLPTGEVDVEVHVAPSETQLLLFGEANGFRSLSVAVPVADGYRNPHVERHNARIREELQDLCTRAGAAALPYLTPADALRVCRAAGGGGGVAYVDVEFPPCTTSLYRAGRDASFLRSEPWRRPAEYMSAVDAAEVRLFRGQVLPSDPCPGDGGDVYFCSAAAILAEFPMRVRVLFRYPPDAAALAAPGAAAADAPPQALARAAAREAWAERRVHAYRVTLNLGGWWWSTVLDDYLPASRAGPVFARCEGDLRKLWFPLLEKAYAKAHGSYAAIQYGDVADALQDLTGLPCSRVDEEWARAAAAGASASDQADLFHRLRSHHERGNMVCLSLPDEDSPASPAAVMGLTFGMSYYVMHMVEYHSLDAAQTHRLVQLRCPTVRPGWDGRWCPESIRWAEEPALAERCGVGGAGAALDSVWLDWSAEVLPHFDGAAICHAPCGHYDYRVRGEFTDGVPSVALEVEVAPGAGPVEMMCTLSQPDDRGGGCGEPGGGGGGDPASATLVPLMLCVSRPKSEDSSTAEGRRQVVHLTCSTDPEMPTEKLNFILGRDVALRYVFEPSSSAGAKGGAPRCDGGGDHRGHVYYIVPRAHGAMQGKPYTLGLLSSRPIDNEAVQVRFVQPHARCDLFHNRREFGEEQMAIAATPVNYQARDLTGLVETTWGLLIGG